jgi:hypothetical protein
MEKYELPKKYDPLSDEQKILVGYWNFSGFRFPKANREFSYNTQGMHLTDYFLFSDVVFEGCIYFDKFSFWTTARFENVLFENGVSFKEVIFQKDCIFQNIDFWNTIQFSFDDAKFNWSVVVLDNM